MKAPIALFVFNRLAHTKRTVEALSANLLAKESDLIIFSDGPRADGDRARVEQVRDYIKNITGFRSTVIHQRERNVGLATSIIEGVTKLCDERDHVIVVEDDLMTSPWFLTYMNDALSLYGGDPEVA